MSILLGLFLLVIGIAMFTFGAQIFFHDKALYAHNHKITGSVRNAISGSMEESQTSSPVELSKGFTIDTRTRELIPCSQLSHESIG
jgi:hypothetical protein